MKIVNLQVNHKENPIGYEFQKLHFSWQVEGSTGKEAETVRLCVWKDDRKATDSEIYDSGEILPADFGGMDVELTLFPRTRYHWQVTVVSDKGEACESDFAWFETGKMEEAWDGKWLCIPEKLDSARVLRSVEIKKPLCQARLYLCGLGMYEVYIDERKAGEEYLMPGFHSYNFVQEYQTLDVTEYFAEGIHELEILLGNGWYKGRYLFEGGFENLYGNHLKVIAELHLLYVNGTSEVIYTDENWQARTSYIGRNNIYDGEIQDYRLSGKTVKLEVLETEKELLKERTSMPLIETEYVKPVSVIDTPSGETVLDFGQMITGWVSLYCRESEDTQIRLQYGEILQGQNFYRDNLRTAKAEFSYVSDGNEKWIRPHFTYYGFRYVKVEGVSKVQKEDFIAFRLMSDCRINGYVKTGNEKVNRLISNVQASQQCNFLDIPTDCPQRDERMGWTGDIAIFSDTACLCRDCAGFLDHYLEMTALEQEELNGSVPLFVPRPPLPSSNHVENLLLQMSGAGACAWGDMATIIPWTLYEHYRDKTMLKKQYPVMRDWVTYVSKRTESNPVPHLWQNDLQLGDWLALDHEDLESPFGKTDAGYLASAYYCYSLTLTLRAAEVLGKTEDKEWIQEELKNARNAFQKEFLQENGELKIEETQTGYAVLLMFELFRNGQDRIAAERLDRLVRENEYHLNTGFIGTPLLCQALSKYGAHETACKVFLQETYPGWLYEVNLGAVTIWERWNSLNPDGSISSTGMNSLNHYAYGSILSWIYRYLCGFLPDSDHVRTLQISPKLCTELKWIKSSYGTPWGTYRVEWNILSESEIRYHIQIPFGGKAMINLPGAKEEMLPAGEYVRVIRSVKQE